MQDAGCECFLLGVGHFGLSLDGDGENAVQFAAMSTGIDRWAWRSTVVTGSFLGGIRPTCHSAPRLSPVSAWGRRLLLDAAALSATPTWSCEWGGRSTAAKQPSPVQCVPSMTAKQPTSLPMRHGCVAQRGLGVLPNQGGAVGHRPLRGTFAWLRTRVSSARPPANTPLRPLNSLMCHL